MTKFFSRGAPKVVIAGGIFDDVALRISLIVKEVGECNPGRSRLLPSRCLLLLLLVILSFLLLVFWGQLQVCIKLLTSSWLTVVGLTTGLHVSSSLVVVVAVFVVVFPFECTMKEPTC